MFHQTSPGRENANELTPRMLATVVRGQASRRWTDGGEASAQPVESKDPAQTGESLVGTHGSEPHHRVGERVL